MLFDLKRPYFYLFLAGLFGIIDSLVLFFYSNLNLGTVFPGMIGAGLVLYVLIKVYVRKGRPLITNTFLRKGIGICLTIGFISFVGVEGLILYNAGSQEEAKADYLIILGAGVRGETLSLTLTQRMERGAAYLKAHPDMKVIVSGGRGPEEHISEAEAMKRYLLNHGIEAGRIIEEDRSRSTMENFKFSREKLLEMKEQGNRVLIITNDFHMLRAKMLAKRNGFEPYGISCPTPWTIAVNCYVREYFAFMKSYFLDR